MSIWLANVDYSPIKGFAEIQGDMGTINSKVVFSEGKILYSEDTYYFCLIAESITDLAKPDSFKPSTQVLFTCHTKDYTRWTKDNPKLPTSVTDLEKALALYLSTDIGTQWLDKSFKGHLNLNGNSTVIEQVIAANFWKMLLEFEECESSLIKDVALKNNSNNGKKNTSYSQTEAQKIDDRVLKLIEYSGAYGKGAKDLVELSASLAEFKKDNPAMYEVFVGLAKIILQK